MWEWPLLPFHNSSTADHSEFLTPSHAVLSCGTHHSSAETGLSHRHKPFIHSLKFRQFQNPQDFEFVALSYLLKSFVLKFQAKRELQFFQLKFQESVLVNGKITCFSLRRCSIHGSSCRFAANRLVWHDAKIAIQISSNSEAHERWTLH